MPSDEKAFEEVVQAHYEPLYRFAFSLSRREADAADLTQRAFERLGEKADTLRDRSKVKTWLFTTLYRDFLQQKRHDARFPESEFDESVATSIIELPRVETTTDAHTAVAALHELEEPFRSALVLFYLQENSYKEIAAILDVPMGTVMSRIARGRELLRARIDPPARLAAPGLVKGNRP